MADKTEIEKMIANITDVARMYASFWYDSYAQFIEKGMEPDMARQATDSLMKIFLDRFTKDKPSNVDTSWMLKHITEGAGS